MNARQNMAVQGFYSLDPWEYSAVLEAVANDLRNKSLDSADIRVALAKIIDDAAQKAKGKGL